jgi:hypothetical protein
MDSQIAVPESVAVVCRLCSHEGAPFVFQAATYATAVRCPRCRRRLRLLTRYVLEARQRRGRHGRRIYDLHTVEPSGRARMRSLAVSGNVQVRPQQWTTFVWRGERLLGVVDQGAGVWQPAAESTAVSLGWGYRALFALVGLLALAHGLRLAAETRALVSSAPATVAVFALVALLLLAPLVLWVLEIVAEEAEEEALDPFAEQR